MHVGWIWECPRCGLSITTAAVRDDVRAGEGKVALTEDLSAKARAL
jgi:hypothetical protein